MTKIKKVELSYDNDTDPKKLFIFLHGLGADANDLLPIAEQFKALFPNSRFISANAPYKCDFAELGYQWFSMMERSEAVILEQIKLSHQLLDDFINNELKLYNLTRSELILVGFSQGAMLSLYCSLRSKEQFAGVISFSGALIGHRSLNEYVLSKPPILLIHGDHDQVVPHTESIKANQTLLTEQIPSKLVIISQLGHNINKECIDQAAEFLKTLYKN